MTIRVALTFDAEHPSRPHCPPGVTEALLAELARAEVRATFFLQGRWARAYPHVAQEIAAAGHLIGNHSHFHARMPLLSDEGLRVDVRSAEEAIVETTGVHPRPWFRCPFGAGSYDPRVLAALKNLGYREVNWDVDAGDWDAGRSEERVTADILRGIEARGDGAIAVLHTWPAITPQVVRALVTELSGRGMSFVGLDEATSAQI